MEPDAAAERPLLQRSTEHLLTGQGQKMGMPNYQDAATDPWTRGSKGHPLGHPLGKIIHAVHLSSINVFKVRLMTMGSFVGRDKGLCSPIIQGFVQNTVWRWKRVH
jgi:hypothetical protein